MSRVAPIRSRSRKIWVSPDLACSASECGLHYFTARTKKALGNPMGAKQITLTPVRRVK